MAGDAETGRRGDEDGGRARIPAPVGIGPSNVPIEPDTDRGMNCIDRLMILRADLMVRPRSLHSRGMRLISSRQPEEGVSYAAKIHQW